MDFKRLSFKLVTLAEENREKWDELDAAQGDGDLGLTIVLGARALYEVSESVESFQAWLVEGGKSFRKAAPSTMGILIASAMISAGNILEPNQNKIYLADAVLIQEAMITEIQKRGGAKLGDKTVLDAFIPAFSTFRDSVQAGKGVSETLQLATESARLSANETKNMSSKIGRSSWLGERAMGNIDGGALVCSQIYDLFKIMFEKSD